MNTNIITSRVEKLRALMNDKMLDVFLLVVDERANSESCHYISGFRGSSAGLIITMNDSVLITDGRYATQSKLQSPFKIIIQSDKSIPQYLADAVNE
ncbi:MAG: aminopeptidase P family N-terminal domain-containing protein, partial [Synergistaceae bacterium]|nr:aminopeptidase P family N-terminal domain-containing protein [Synergistaceae bacterium]